MVASPLVEPYLDAGADLVRHLDEVGLDVVGAFWLYSSESDSWRLVVVSPIVDGLEPQNAYSRLLDLLPAESPIRLQDISLVGPESAVAKRLRKLVRTKPKAVASVRVSRTAVDGEFIEDALVYRSA